jgi:hypothetical protein
LKSCIIFHFLLSCRLQLGFVWHNGSILRTECYDLSSLHGRWSRRVTICDRPSRFDSVSPETSRPPLAVYFGKEIDRSNLCSLVTLVLPERDEGPWQTFNQAGSYNSGLFGTFWQDHRLRSTGYSQRD